MLHRKVIVMAEAILFVTSILICSVSVYMARSSMRNAIWQRMLDISNCAAASVDGDYLGSLTADEVGSKEYNDLYKKLAVFRDNVELKYIYSLKRSGDGFIFTMDTDPIDPASFGDTAENTEALESAASGTAAVDKVPYTDQWGKFYSAYSPVLDSSGNVVGIIAVDFASDWFDEQLSAQTVSTVRYYIVILICALLVAAILLMLIVRPFMKMHGKLYEEKVSAESANRAKSDFLANMSHEIRTPINAMLGMNEMILRESRRALDEQTDDADLQKHTLKNIVMYSSDVENAGHNLLAIINDILDFSKIEAGRLDLVEQPYRITGLLSSLSSMISLKARDKKLNFFIDVDESLPDELCGDEVRVRQIFTNILNNAVKYTDQGEVTMSLKGEHGDNGMITLVASIKDTGIGIRQEDMEKLFGKFERFDMERNSTVEGTGLGLAITQKLIDMMGGSIGVESEYGKGSTFTVTIPQKIALDVSAQDFMAVAEATTGEEKRRLFTAPSAHILVVDDTRVNLTVISYLLKDTLMMVDTASNGAEAVEMAAKTKYDVIIMDQRMPEMDGTQALHNIRSSNGESKDTPIICFTADAVVGARERYLEEGFSDYITKPVSGYALEEMLLRHLPAAKVDN